MSKTFCFAKVLHLQNIMIIKIAALSSHGNDFKIIRILREGCCAYLYKDIHVLELKKALTEIYQLGYYNADSINIFKRRVIKIALGLPDELVLHERERIVATVVQQYDKCSNCD